MDEDHCRVLGTFQDQASRSTDKLYTHGLCSTVLAEDLGRNQGPTKLDGCKIHNVVLANGLRK
jgi:hypothetical protein